MRVLVDTSAWIDFFNGFPSPEAEAVAQLIRDEADLVTCGVIAAEFLQGIRQSKTLQTLERHFCDMDWLAPDEPGTYLAAAKLFRELRSRGITIRSTVDCLIAQLSAEAGVLLLAKDRDLRLIVDSELIDVRALPLA